MKTKLFYLIFKLDYKIQMKKKYIDVCIEKEREKRKLIKDLYQDTSSERHN